MKFKTRTSLRISLALALVVALAALTLSVGSPTASAADETNVTFTKWVTVFPNMAGTIGGDVTGSFDGKVLSSPDFTKPVTEIEASYHFNTGGDHSFTARVNVTQDNQTGTATIKGVVTEGWLKGAAVAGEYKVIIACAQASPAKAPDNLCFQGTLRIAGS